MASVREFLLPDLGEGLTEATVVRWMVAVGDVVAVDQPVIEVETAKALVDVPCPYGGVVTARFGEEGAEIPVGTPLLTVAVGAADDPARPAPAHESPVGASAPAEAAATESSGNVLVGYGTGASTGRRRRSRPVDGFRLSPGNGTAGARGPGSRHLTAGATPRPRARPRPARHRGLGA